MTLTQTEFPAVIAVIVGIIGVGADLYQGEVFSPWLVAALNAWCWLNAEYSKRGMK